MEAQTVGRRQVLRGAGVVAGGAAVATLGFAAPAIADDGSKHGGLLGAWRVTRQDEGGTPVAGFASFASGGVSLFQDINPVGPSFCGAFGEGDHSKFKATILSGSRAEEAFPGSPALTSEAHVEGTRHNDTITGTYSVTSFDAVTGDALGPPTPGTFTGTRIRA